MLLPPARSVSSHPLIRPLAIAASALIIGCARRPPVATLLPGVPTTPVTPDERTLAIYRTIADSIYIRTTARTIGVVTTTLDTACASLPCVPVAERFGVGSLWWQHADSSEATSARASLLTNSTMRYDLRSVAAGRADLVPIAPDRLPDTGGDVAPWIAFRDGNSLAAGALQFSGVGFGRSGQTALVYVDWRCGPACGHTLSVSLTATSEGAWKISDMLLLSSLQHD